MAVVAGLFDSQANATEAMDDLMNRHFHDLETRVVGGKNDDSDSQPGLVLPVVPNTGGGYAQPGGIIPFGAAADVDWLRELGEEERGFYYEGLKEGASLAVVKVADEDADNVRRLLNMHGARAYEKK